MPRSVYLMFDGGAVVNGGVNMSGVQMVEWGGGSCKCGIFMEREGEGKGSGELQCSQEAEQHSGFGTWNHYPVFLTCSFFWPIPSKAEGDYTSQILPTASPFNPYDVVFRFSFRG